MPAVTLPLRRWAVCPRPAGPPPPPPVPLRPGTRYRLDSATGPLVRLLEVSACGHYARVENCHRLGRHETRASRLVAATPLPA